MALRGVTDTAGAAVADGATLNITNYSGKGILQTVAFYFDVIGASSNTFYFDVLIDGAGPAFDIGSALGNPSPMMVELTGVSAATANGLDAVITKYDSVNFIIGGVWTPMMTFQSSLTVRVRDINDGSQWCTAGYVRVTYETEV